MFELFLPLGIFLLGILVGFMDSTVGSGGLLLIPALIFFGFTPQSAVAMDRLATIGQEIGAIITYWKSKKIIWSYVVGFSILALIGAYIGANLLLKINPKNLEKIIGVLLLISLPLIILKQDVGIKRVVTNLFKKILGHIFYFLIMIYNGFFGTGAGPLATYNETLMFGFTIIESNATTMIPWLLLSTFSVIIFTNANLINYTQGIPLVIGMLIGGYIGAHTLIKIGNIWVKRLFIVVVLMSGITLLFF